MTNHTLSRRDFLKLTLTSLTATFLAACGRALGIPVPFPHHRADLDQQKYILQITAI